MLHCHKDICAWYNTAHYIKYPVFKYLMWKAQVTLEHLNREKCGKFTFESFYINANLMGYDTHKLNQGRHKFVIWYFNEWYISKEMNRIYLQIVYKYFWAWKYGSVLFSNVIYLDFYDFTFAMPLHFLVATCHKTQKSNCYSILQILILYIVI